MNDFNKEAVSPSRPLICSADGQRENAEREPPNLRFTMSCKNCKYGNGYNSYGDDNFCRKYETFTNVRHICDDYK